MVEEEASNQLCFLGVLDKYVDGLNKGPFTMISTGVPQGCVLSHIL